MGTTTKSVTASGMRGNARYDTGNAVALMNERRECAMKRTAFEQRLIEAHLSVLGEMDERDAAYLIGERERLRRWSNDLCASYGKDKALMRRWYDEYVPGSMKGNPYFTADGDMPRIVMQCADRTFTELWDILENARYMR